MTFFTNKKGLAILLLVVVSTGLALTQCGDDESVVEERQPQQESSFYCEELTGELCKKKCEPFNVKSYRPGFVLRYAVDGGIYLFRSCSRDAVQESAGDFSDACACEVQ